MKPEKCLGCKKKFDAKKMFYAEFDIYNPEDGEELSDCPFYWCSEKCIKKTLKESYSESDAWLEEFRRAFPQIDFKEKEAQG